ncbi:YhcN/YlaJ family sporulation lipoprotein [Brevibacillus laterosporus]|uniref:YhcN/YlaJ family sporulation lipoprotein n=1 Tax=Brevibacillus laterosporus TaxID=1465 RepID=UPI0018F89EB6|nr:YhcN/YlaJ family sporulation lipoprotein [Brevibacillus laterosporus]MBG9773634.1 hypothetical protein [Brevibacillus laterosporus]
MKQIYTGIIWSSAMVLTISLLGCSTHSPGGTNTQIGIQDYKSDRRNNHEFVEPGPVKMMYQGKNTNSYQLTAVEERAKKVPGVLDAKAIIYGDTMVIGVITDGTPNGKYERKPIQRDPTSELRPKLSLKLNVDGHDNRIIRGIRDTLIRQDKARLVFITPDYKMYKRILSIHDRLLAGQYVDDSEFRRLINDVGAYTEGFSAY